MTTNYIYFIQSETGGNIKIGRSFDVASRLKSLQTGSPLPLKLLNMVAETESLTERSLHQRFKAHRQHNEWFAPVEELVQFISSMPMAEYTVKASEPEPELEEGLADLNIPMDETPSLFAVGYKQKRLQALAIKDGETITLIITTLETVLADWNRVIEIDNELGRDGLRFQSVSKEVIKRLRDRVKRLLYVDWREAEWFINQYPENIKEYKQGVKERIMWMQLSAGRNDQTISDHFSMFKMDQHFYRPGEGLIWYRKMIAEYYARNKYDPPLLIKKFLEEVSSVASDSHFSLRT